MLRPDANAEQAGRHALQYWKYPDQLEQQRRLRPLLAFQDAADDPRLDGELQPLREAHDRGDYWQCAYVIAKGGIERVKERGFDAFRNAVVQMSPFLADRIGNLKSWDDIKLLSVAVDRLRQWWRPRPDLHTTRHPEFWRAPR